MSANTAAAPVRAVTVEPGGNAGVIVERLPAPPGEGSLLVEALAVGVCGTDREIVAGDHGRAPDGRRRLVLGHESLGRVLDAPRDADVAPGDLVVGIVRRPDPVPCPNCAVGEWDMCRNGRYTERGIRGLDGYGAERFRLEPEFAVRVPRGLGPVGVLTEPTSVVAKAWEHIEHVGRRARWEPRQVLVTGAGPIGLLAALLGVQRGYDVHVLDRVSSGPKPGLVHDLGATYHHGELQDVGPEIDVVVECTGAPQLVFDAIGDTARGAIVCLTGVSSGGRMLEVPAGSIARELVLENDVVLGSVNANRRHYEAAVDALDRADRSWLERLLTRRVRLDEVHEAYASKDATDDVKVVIELAAADG